MQLTQGQQDALQVIRGLVKSARPDFLAVGVLEGYAGTGKTTLVRRLPQEVGRDAVVLCPTGKAALRAREVTDLETSTIHRWLYHAGTDPVTGEPTFRRKGREELSSYSGKLIVVDEASMLGDELWMDLRDALHGIEDVAVLLVGDGFQLPPVKSGKEGWCALQVETKHRAKLTEVMRQALDSPVIRAAHKVREGATSKHLFDLVDMVPGGQVKQQADLVQKRGGAVLLHTNKGRAALNNWIRRQRGLPGDLIPGEPLLVLLNEYSLDRYNGEIVRFDGWAREPGWTSGTAQVGRLGEGDRLDLSFGLAELEGGLEAMVCPELVAGVGQDIQPFEARRAARRAAKAVSREPLPYLHAAHGYVLTAHKAQGSEWDEALVVVEPTIRQDTEEGRRWLYTALTRARKMVSLAMVPWGCWDGLL